MTKYKETYGQFTISIPSNFHKSELLIRVYDVVGQFIKESLIRSKKKNEGQFEIDLYGLSSGLYELQILDSSDKRLIDSNLILKLSKVHFIGKRS